MTRKQIIVLILGCVLLCAGFYVLIRMTQVKNVNDLSGLFASEPAQTSVPAVEPAPAKEPEEAQAGFDRMLEGIVDLHIPVWGYFVIFIVLVLSVRFYMFRYEVKSAEKSIKMRQAAQAAAESPADVGPEGRDH